MKQILCKKSFTAKNFNNFNIIAGEYYRYWINFEGLNHFISDGTNVYPFDGEQDQYANIFNTGDTREYLYDYFYTKEELRELKIDKIITKC